MYPIDFLTCTAIDVITRSLVCHPTLFAEAVADQRLTHVRYARTTHDRMASKSALDQADACARILEIVAAHEGEAAAWDIAISGLSPLVVAFNVAAKLNLVPQACKGDMIARTPWGEGAKLHAMAKA